MKLRLAILAGAAVTLAGCALSPEQFETTPIVVDTDQGPVTCQLYKLDQVTWDRATNRPDAMSVQTADTICRNEGARILKEGTTGLVEQGGVLRRAQGL